MKLLRLKVRSNFKNLKNVEMVFSPDTSRTVIIGQNGTGKSNIIEALVKIFLHLDDGSEPPFSYELDYKLGDESLETWMSVDADPSRESIYKIEYQTTSNGKEHEPQQAIDIAKVMRNKDGVSAYLPRNIFAYYSGPSDRLERLFFQKRKEFYQTVRHKDDDISSIIRPFFYAKGFHSQFSLLAFFSARGFPQAKKFLERELSISKFESATFFLKKPLDAKSDDSNDFWGMKGAIRVFLDQLKTHGIGPIAQEEDTLDLHAQRSKRHQVISYHLPNLKALELLAKTMRPSDFFKVMEASYLSGTIERLEIRVTLASRAEDVSFTELSEGEQQMLTVFGLLQFNEKKDSLFLLDEPDTHLNPYWAAKYHQILEMFLPDGFLSHIVMTTHHPLTIFELDSQQIQMVRRSMIDQSISVSTPAQSPKGMTVNGILTSDMFGLLTTLDQNTQKLIQERRELLATGKKAGRLEELNGELEELGYGYIHPDEDYRQFLIARSKYLKFGQEVASVEARKQLVKNLLKDLGISDNEAH
ncbi:AAA family ATPase [Aeromonas veronii]|uniref:AAA family ATPase n=1 Tax=Aeromonas veronii TaxID=654 RepID=UPI002B48EF78|nr:AAA family ATPase [Aeromonas veronii]